MTQADSRHGMTLVEILLVVTLVALLSAALVPAINAAVRHRKNAEAASKIRTLVAAFEMYASENADYPADKNRGISPPEMADCFSSLNIDWFTEVTLLGGRWDWGKNTMGFLATISVAGPTVSPAQLIELDRLMDDGNLTTGKFRQDGDHYFYIIKQ